MDYAINREGVRLVVEVGGRLDAQTSPELESSMGEVLEGVTEIIFDLGELDYISSAGMRILLASYKLTAKRGGAMRVENANGDVIDTLEMSGFASVFGIE